MDQTAAEVEADAFFAQFVDASPETVARLSLEGTVQGDLMAVLAEAQAYHFDARKRARRQQRKAARVAAQAREAAHTAAEAVRLAQSGARILYPLPEALAALPPVRLLTRSRDQQRADQRRAAAFWARLADEQERQRTVERARAAWEASQRARAARQARRDAATAALRRADAQAARAEQVRRQRAAAAQRHQDAVRRREFRPAGMTAERALEIALGVLDRHPQAWR